MLKAPYQAVCYEGAVQQDCESFILLAAADGCFDIQAYMFRMICDIMGKQGMVDERIVL
jgi:hypothetical protein